MATLKQAEQIVNELSESDRRALLQRLIDRVDPVSPETEKAWRDESRSRLEAMRDGTLELIDEEEAFSRAFKSLDEKS